MSAWPHTFGAESGAVAASQLDDNFNAAANESTVTALAATVAGLPSSSVPLIPVAAGAAGAAATLSRSDHQHPPQAATQNLQAGTSYTVTATDNGKVIALNNAGAITVTVPNSLAADFSCMFYQKGAGQVTFVAGASATLQQRAGKTKTSGQWAVISMFGDSNAGGSAFVGVLSGDMA